MTVRIHHVSCSVMSGPAGTDSFDEAAKRAAQLERYARRLGFDVMYENVDEGERGDEPNPSLVASSHQGGEEG